MELEHTREMFVWRIYEYPLILEKKRAEISNSRQFQGSFAAAKGPHAVAKVHAATKGSHTATWLRRKNGPTMGSPRRSEAMPQ